MGFALRAAVFGLIAVATAYAVTWRLAKAIDGGDRAGPDRLRLLWKRAVDMGEACAEVDSDGADGRYNG